jgi:glutamate-ammonia-ligase adenylyltransferase
MRSTRAREMLTELMPALLKALAGTPGPDRAFLRFDEFLSGLPAGVQLFSMFYSNPHLLDLVAEIMGQAPRLAAHLSRRPSVLDSVLTADFFDAPPPPEALAGELDRLLDRAGDFEDVLDLSRRWANDRTFQVGVQSLRGHLAPRAAAAALSNIAEAALNRLQPRVEKEFARQHGRVAGSAMAIVAMGKLGGREMTSASDLDLIFIYTTPEAVGASDGPKALPSSQYFARLSQRLISAVTAQTAEGRLYEVDMRLRPSGSAGPIACSHEAFVRYHEKEAWTWEHMALTRARVIAGPSALREPVEAAIADVLTRPRDTETLLLDVAEMRARMDNEHHTDFIWEIKHLRGGLVDVEFIAQYLELKHAHARPEVLSPNTRTALRRLRDSGLLEAPVADDLIEGLDLWQAIQGLLRLTIEGDVRQEADSEIPEGLQEALARLGGAVDFVALEEKVVATAGRVHRHFVDLIETPAKAVADKRPNDAGKRENGPQA